MINTSYLEPMEKITAEEYHKAIEQGKEDSKGVIHYKTSYDGGGEEIYYFFGDYAYYMNFADYHTDIEYTSHVWPGETIVEAFDDGCYYVERTYGGTTYHKAKCEFIDILNLVAGLKSNLYYYEINKHPCYPDDIMETMAEESA